jgi:hypothetical protein
MLGSSTQGEEIAVQTAERDFEQAARFGAAFNRRSGSGDGARLRLGLAVAGLAALIGWGVLSHVQTGPSADSRGNTSAQETLLDGHGKWTGYTSR